jgi:heterotetrameric sarcosine oxidase gamma subunit
MSDSFAFLSPAAITANGEHALLRTPMERNHLAAGGTLEEAAGWRIAHYPTEPGDAWLADVSHTGKIDVRGSRERVDELTAGAELGTAKLHEGVWTLRISPTHVVVLCPFDRVATLCDRIGFGATDMTCGWAAVTLGGPRLRDVFMRSSALDVRESRFPPGRCLAGSVMRCPTIVLNEDGERFRMLVGWEFGEYFWEAIMDAGHGMAITPVSAAVALREEVAV